LRRYHDHAPWPVVSGHKSLALAHCIPHFSLPQILAALGGSLPVTDLPVVAAAPEYVEQKATIDAVFALAFGLYTYVNPIPTVTGAPNLVKLLTQDCPQVTGGLLSVETDYVKAVDGMLAHIEAKRKKLGI
jgi:carbon-monoxide dehydrogenase catalytic subunit